MFFKDAGLEDTYICVCLDVSGWRQHTKQVMSFQCFFGVLQVPWNATVGSVQRVHSSVEPFAKALDRWRGHGDRVQISPRPQILQRAWSNCSELSGAWEVLVWVSGFLTAPYNNSYGSGWLLWALWILKARVNVKVFDAFFSHPTLLPSAAKGTMLVKPSSTLR